MRTQWRIGAAGRTGLDYTACGWTWAAHRERYQLPPDGDLMQDVTVLEHAMLQADHEYRDSARDKKSGAAIGADRDKTMGA